MSRLTDYEDWSRLLKRHPNFERYDTSWLNNRSVKGVFVRLSEKVEQPPPEIVDDFDDFGPKKDAQGKLLSL